jgi:serine O-acetyltransferase
MNVAATRVGAGERPRAERMHLRATLREDLSAYRDRTGSRIRWWHLLALPLSPALTALVLMRAACWLRSRRVGVLARVVYAFNVYLTGCEIHPEAEIGPGLFMPHPNGIMMAPVRIGRNCILAPFSGLGARGGWAEDGMPVVGDNVTIYLHSTVLGPVTVGDDVVIAGYSMVTESIPAGMLAAGVPAKLLRPLRADEILRQRRPSERARPLPTSEGPREASRA